MSRCEASVPCTRTCKLYLTMLAKKCGDSGPKQKISRAFDKCLLEIVVCDHWEKLNRGGSKLGGFLLSGNVRIVSRTLSGLFLVAAVNRPRKRKGTNRQDTKTMDPRGNREDPRRSGKSRKELRRTKKEGQAQNGKPPRLKPPRLAALEFFTNRRPTKKRFFFLSWKSQKSEMMPYLKRWKGADGIPTKGIGKTWVFLGSLRVFSRYFQGIVAYALLRVCAFVGMPFAPFQT